MSHALVETIARECGGARRSGHGFTCRCPAHETEKSSNSCKLEWLNDNVVPTCFAGCKAKDIYDAMRIVSATFAAWDKEQFERKKEEKKAQRPRKAKDKDDGPKVKPIKDWIWTFENVFKARVYKLWPWKDEAGELLYYSVRIDYLEKDGKEVYPLSPADAEKKLFLLSASGVRRVLLNLPEVREQAATGASVFFVEGEKKCDVLADWGLVGTAILGGCKQELRKDMIDSLKGVKQVIMMPDHDEVGMRFTHKCALALNAAGIVVKWLTFHEFMTDDLPRDGGLDVWDWRAQGHDADELLERAGKLPVWTPEQTFQYDERSKIDPTANPDAPHASPFTDTANAERLVKNFQKDILYVPQSDKHRPWWIWNGKHWDNDSSHKMILFAQKSAHASYKELINTRLPSDKIDKWYESSLNRAGISNAIVLAAPYCGFNLTDFDPNPYFINVLNGVVDLRSGELLEHDPSFRCSRIVPVFYRGLDYQCKKDEWREFNKWAFNGNDEVIDFMRRWRGYCLTGLTGEQKFAMYYGKEGANGKSIIIENQLRLAGGYGFAASRDLVMERQSASKESNPAQIVGMRLVTIDEIGKRDRFDESRMRALTGEDTITGSNLYAPPFSFKPICKLVMRGNEKPYLDGGDANEASWRRFIFVEFPNTMPEKQRKKGLSQYFWDNYKEEMLSEAVRGAIEAEDGVLVPEKITTSTDELRKEFDLLGEFITWLCRREGECPAIEFIEAFSLFLRKMRHNEWSANRIGRELTARGIERGRIQDALAYKGLSLKPNWRELLEPFVSQMNGPRYSRQMSFYN